MAHKYTNILKKTKMFNNVKKNILHILFLYAYYISIFWFCIIWLTFSSYVICLLPLLFSYSTFIIGFTLNIVLWKIFPRLKSNFVASYHPVLLDLSLHNTILFFHVSSLHFFIHSSLSNTDRRGCRDRMEVGYLSCM